MRRFDGIGESILILKSIFSVVWSHLIFGLSVIYSFSLFFNVGLLSKLLTSWTVTRTNSSWCGFLVSIIFSFRKKKTPQNSLKLHSPSVLRTHYPEINWHWIFRNVFEFYFCSSFYKHLNVTKTRAIKTVRFPAVFAFAEMSFAHLFHMKFLISKCSNSHFRRHYLKRTKWSHILISTGEWILNYVCACVCVCILNVFTCIRTDA